MRFRNLMLATLAALSIGALANLPSSRNLIAQGFEGIFRDGSSAGPSVRGQSASPGLYFNSTGVGFTRHLFSGFAGTNNLPVLSACGTSPTIVGNDVAGKITVGTTASAGCTATFGTAWATAPICVYQNLTTGAPANVLTTSTTAMVWSSVLADSTVLVYHCIGLADG